MELVVIESLFLLLSTAGANNSCMYQAESYVKAGYTQPGDFREYTEQGNLIYYVRTNEQGGDAAYEVQVTPDCSLVSVKLLWTE